MYHPHHLPEDVAAIKVLINGGWDGSIIHSIWFDLIFNPLSKIQIKIHRWQL